MATARSASLERHMTGLQMARCRPNTQPTSRLGRYVTNMQTVRCSSQPNMRVSAPAPRISRSTSTVHVFRDKEQNRTVCTISFAEDKQQRAYCSPEQVPYRLPTARSARKAASPKSATTASAAPYSSDIIGSYNNDNSRSSGQQADELRNGSISDRQTDRRRHGQQAKEREGALGELRPGSLKSRQLSIIANCKGRFWNNRPSTTAMACFGSNVEREKDSRLKDDTGSILPPPNSQKNGTSSSYTNGFRPMNARNTFLGGQQITPLPTQQRSSQLSSNTSSSYSRDSEDLVATGTNPLQPQAVIVRRPGSIGQSNGVQSSSSSGALTQMNGTASRKLPVKSNVFAPASSIRVKDLTEPRYSDPLQGAPPTFQQRMAEINSLEQETLRYERAKKFKRKTKSET